MSEFGHEGHRIRYDSYGEGDRVIILAHGLLMNRGMFSRLGPALADRGHRVICVDLLGHGRSDRIGAAPCSVPRDPHRHPLIHRDRKNPSSRRNFAVSRKRELPRHRGD